jgi:hypothetical protein
MNRFPNNLSDEDLARMVGMMGAVALLLGASVLLSTGVSSPQVLVAATDLGTIQGLPPSVSYAAPADIRPSKEDILNMQYPDLPTCWINIGRYSYGIVGSQYAPASVQSTWCLNVPDNPETLSDYYQDVSARQWWGSTFYSGMFSVNAAAAPTVGMTSYIKSSFLPHNDQDLYLGPAGCVFSYDENGNYSCNGYTGGDGGTTYPGSCDAYTVPEGYSGPELVAQGSGDDGAAIGVCYAKNTNPTQNSLKSQVLEEGSTPQVAPGGDLTLEWSCLPNRTEDWWMRYWRGNWYGGGYYTDTGGTVYNVSPLGTKTDGGGPGFDTGGDLVNKMTIKAPVTKGTYTYTLACNGTGSYIIQPEGTSGGPTWDGYGVFSNVSAVSGKLPVMSVAVEVTDEPIQVPPTASFSGDDSCTVGRSCHIVANFAVHNDGENILGSAINGCNKPNQTGCQVSVDTSGTPQQLDYIFTPGSAGVYTFYAALKTSVVPGWHNYAETKVKVANPSLCKNPPDPAKTQACFAAETPTQSKIVESCSTPAVACEYTCAFGYTFQDGQCVVAQCTGAHEENPPSCTCVSGYERDDTTNQCVRKAPTLDHLTVNPTRVRAGSSTTVEWEVTGLATDGSESCAVTSVPSDALFQSYDPSGGPDWSQSVGVTIDSTTIFTLSCHDDTTGKSYSLSATAGLIPVSKEI